MAHSVIAGAIAEAGGALLAFVNRDNLVALAVLADV